MLELIKFVLEKLDIIALADSIRERKNRRLAATLHLVLVQAYEILELYRVLLAELRAALESHRATESGHEFHLNPDHISTLLSRQASNLSVMERLTVDLLDALRVIDNRFLESYRALIPGKMGVLYAAEGLLAGGRLPLAETGPEEFPASSDGTYRTLWFTRTEQSSERRVLEKYLHGYAGEEKVVVDVALSDGDAFFKELERYFSEQHPEEKLQELTELTESFKEKLITSFTTSELLGEIGGIRRHFTHLP